MAQSVYTEPNLLLALEILASIVFFYHRTMKMGYNLGRSLIRDKKRCDNITRLVDFLSCTQKNLPFTNGIGDTLLVLIYLVTLIAHTYHWFAIFVSDSDYLLGILLLKTKMVILTLKKWYTLL